MFNLARQRLWESPIEVKKANTNYSSCANCTRLVQKGALIAKPALIDRVCHLGCFRPYKCVPILIESQVKVDPSLTETEVERVKERFEKWNRQFVVEEKQVPERFRGKCVKQVDLKRRRLFVEIFRFLSPGELEKLVALVCQEWYEFTREDEIWIHFLSSEFSVQSTCESPRTKFIACWLGACWHCKRSVPLAEVFMRCPLMKRPLCTTCSKVPSLHIVDLPWFLRRKNIQVTTGYLLQFPSFSYMGRPKCCYAKLLQNLITPYAERRLQLLVQGLESEGEQGLAALAKRFSTERFYDECMFSPSVNRPVSIFCGKNEKRENFAQSYETCRDKLREIQAREIERGDHRSFPL